MSLPTTAQRYEEFLDGLRQADRWRQTAPLPGEVISFSSNDYLGLSQDTRMVGAAQDALARFGCGTGSARLIDGTLALHHQLEEAVAQWKGAEAALVFNSGYQGNVAILSGLVGAGDWIFLDSLNHASLVDGSLLSKARISRYPHLDYDVLEKKLQAAPPDALKWIVTDTVFSMDGDRADLKTLNTLAHQYNAWLLLDDAHGCGLYGSKRWSGWAEHCGGHGDHILHGGTFSKALGSFGGYVAGSRLLIDMLVNRARGFIYSTSLPPAVIAANLEAIAIVQQDATPRNTLTSIARLTLQECEARQIPWPVATNSPMPAIIPIMVGEDTTAMAWSRQLLASGFHVKAIRPPTVPEGEARLRIGLSARHTPEQIRDLFQAMDECIQRFGPLPEPASLSS